MKTIERTYCGADWAHPHHEFEYEGHKYSCTGDLLSYDPEQWMPAFPESAQPRKPLLAPPSKMCGDGSVHAAHPWAEQLEDDVALSWQCFGIEESDLPPLPEPEEYTTSKGTWQQGVLFDRGLIPLANWDRADELAEWWMGNSARHVASLIPKAINYGSVDLDIMGESLLSLLPNLRGVVSGQELAIAFYLQGKISRLFGGYEQGVVPSADSFDDIQIYAGMAQRVRETGKW